MYNVLIYVLIQYRMIATTVLANTSITSHNSHNYHFFLVVRTLRSILLATFKCIIQYNEL